MEQNITNKTDYNEILKNNTIIWTKISQTRQIRMKLQQIIHYMHQNNRNKTDYNEIATNYTLYGSK